MAGEHRKMPPWGGRPLIAKITFGFVILGFAALAARVAVTLASPVDPLDQKIAGAQRYLYYQFTPTSGPSFVLVGNEGEIHLVSHVVMPPGKYDPTRELEYGARVEIDLGGGKTWTREIFTRTRQSKAREDAKRKLWLDENTFSLERDIEISDDRVLIFQLPTEVSAGARMRVRLVGAAREGFLRAYTPIPRPDTERHVRELPGADRKRIAEGTSYVPWDRLTAPYSLASMRFAPHRLSAEGKDGIDYETHTLYTSSFRLPYALVTVRGTPVAPDHAIAVNVVGPAQVLVNASPPIEGGHGTVSVQLVGENMPAPGQPAPAPIAIPIGQSGPISVPAGVFTLAISADARALVELVSPPTTPITLGKIADAPLVPDEQLLPAYLAGPNAPKLELATDGPDDLLGRVVRIDVRTLATMPCLAVTGPLKRWPTGDVVPTPARGMLPPAPPCTGAAVPADLIDSNLTVEAIDASGKVMSTSTAKIESAPSKFETVKIYNNLTASVCEPISIRFVVPPGGKLVRLRVDKPALVTAATPVTLSPPADTVDAPYDSLAPQVTTIWRYARYKERGWLPIRARDHATWPAEWLASLDVQARLETKIIPPAPEITSTSLSPAGRLEQQTVVELVPGDDVALFLQRWGDGHYTRLVPGKASQLDLGRLPSRPSIMYFAGDDQVGSPANVTIDSDVVEGKLSASRGTLKLPAGLAGTHAVSVDAPDKTRLLIDRPPAAGTRGELYAVRTVYRLGSGHSARLVVGKRTALPQNVDIVLYARSAAADPNAQIRIVIDGGHPARRAGTAITRWTLADRTLPLPPSDRPATLGFANAGADALAPRLIAIALGDDLPPGAHTVEVSVTSGPPMWARLFTFDGVPPAPRALQWRVQADVGESN
jgi:hypothetical protein